MSRKPLARCALQVARQHRPSAHPGEVGCGQDICDVNLRLREKFNETSLILWIERHYSQRDREIAGVKVITEPGRPLSLTPPAREALLTLGFLIENTSADTCGMPLCERHQSRHEALRAFARVEAALRKWRSR